MSQKAKLLPPELALGALGVELATAKNLENLLHIQNMLIERRRVY